MLEMNATIDHIVIVNLDIMPEIKTENLLEDILNSTTEPTEPNIFSDPYKSIWSKVIGTASYTLGILASITIFSFLKHEVQDQNKTIINLLLAFGYFLVIIDSENFLTC